MARVCSAASCARCEAASAAASAAMACNASATFWKALITVDRYCAAAWSYAARAAASRCLSAPPSMSVSLALPASVQNVVPGENSLASEDADEPHEFTPSVTSGRRLATATPMSALAERSCASAASTSGRCSTSVDGSVSGKGSGSVSPASVNSADIGVSGSTPLSDLIWSRCSASCFSSGGSVASSAASWASCCATSSVEFCPSACSLR